MMMAGSDSDTPLFRTVVPVSSNTRRISHGSSIMSIGSCFAENIGTQLTAYRFEPLRNPTGVVYNPLSLAANLKRFLDGRHYAAEETFEHEGNWRSFDYHSQFIAPSQEELLHKLNRILSSTHTSLNSLHTLIITLGTAYGYFLAGTKRIVSNCHRLPANQFDRKLISVEDAAARLSEVLERLIVLRPSLNVILTVSPVRHLRDDPHENSISKAHLICTAAALEHTFSENVFYFPAYEIMMDELRDYRFYGSDMAHPSSVAINYIWKRFCGACLSEKAQRFIHDYESIRSARRHRIDEPTSTQTKRFARTMLDRLDALKQTCPEVSLDDDRDYFQTLL
ncbi:MAG: GSCFA domain-containing protein [Chitinivibrionales bacterium]